MSRIANSLSVIAGAGAILLFAGILVDSRSVAIAGGVALSVPAAMMVYRLITHPPSVLDSVEIAVGVPDPAKDVETSSHNEAKSTLRNAGEERPKT